MKNEGEKENSDNNKFEGNKGVLLDSNFLKYNSSAALANFVQPIFALFLPLLASQLHASIFEIGLVGGASGFVYAFMPFVMGRFSDRGQARKFFIISSLALLSIVSTLYYFAANPVDLILLRLTEGLGWATFWPSMDSAVSHDTRADPARALAIFNISWSSAAALGPLVGGYVIVIFSVRDVFVFNAIFLIISLMINLLPHLRIRKTQNYEMAPPSSSNFTITRNESTSPKENRGTSINSNPFSGGNDLKIRRAFYVLSMMMCTIAYGTLTSFLSPYARSQNISIIVIGAILFTYGAARCFGYILTSNERVREFFLNQRSRIRNVLLMLIILSLSSLLMTIHSSSGFVYFVSFGLVGLSYSFIYYIAMIALLAEASKEKMGAGAGIFESSIGMGSLVGPVIAGAVAGNSLTIPFVVPSLISIPMVTVLFFLSRTGRKA